MQYNYHLHFFSKSKTFNQSMRHIKAFLIYSPLFWFAAGERDFLITNVIHYLFNFKNSSICFSFISIILALNFILDFVFLCL